jgi:hypothetical protein
MIDSPRGQDRSNAVPSVLEANPEERESERSVKPRSQSIMTIFGRLQSEFDGAVRSGVAFLRDSVMPYRRIG